MAAYTDKKAAVVWIRDGVLLNVMHINSVAFASAVMKTYDGKADLLPEELVNFYFKTSGISLDDRLSMLDSKYGGMLHENVKMVKDLFNKNKARLEPEYSPKILDVVKELYENGVSQFITSINDQAVLDSWLKSDDGAKIAGSLTEALGTREDGFKKGREHFSYIKTRYSADRIYLVADAPSEIKMGTELGREFGIKTVGFANVVTKEMVKDASAKMGMEIDEKKIRLPDKYAVRKGLEDAGAGHIVYAIDELRDYFKKEKIIV